MKRGAQNGSALLYILIAIALLGLITATFMGSSNQQASGQKTFDLVTDMNSQIQTIRSGIQECVLTYPAGDTTMPAAPANVGGYSVVRPYPLMINNPYLLNPDGSGSLAVDKIRCPGNPGNSNNHIRMFGGATGKFIPAPPDNFTEWSYYNGPDGVYILTNTIKTDAYLKTSLQKLNDQFSPCEAEFIDASTVTKTTTSHGWTCLSGTLCFRVWLVVNPSAEFPDEPGCPPP